MDVRLASVTLNRHIRCPDRPSAVATELSLPLATVNHTSSFHCCSTDFMPETRPEIYTMQNRDKIALLR